MALLVDVTPFAPQSWIDGVLASMPEIEIRTLDDPGDPAEIEFALVGRVARGTLARFPNLRLIGTIMAGVDWLLGDPDLPPGVPVVRCGNPAGDAMITENVMLHVLRHHRQLPAYAAAQARAEWIRLAQPMAAERGVGFMGLGVIARPAAERVRDLGFRVAAWTRRPSAIAGIESFHGAAGLAPFLARSEIVVNLLPLTTETREILNADAFAAMPEGAAVINLGRGEHVADADLMAALDSGHLAAATLDVYRTEPLPAEDPLWRHAMIILMPHCSRQIKPSEIAPQIADCIRRLRAGEKLPQTVDREAGY